MGICKGGQGGFQRGGDRRTIGRAIACKPGGIGFGFWIADFGFKMRMDSFVSNPKSKIRDPKWPYAIAPGTIGSVIHAASGM